MDCLLGGAGSRGHGGHDGVCAGHNGLSKVGLDEVGDQGLTRNFGGRGGGPCESRRRGKN